jgi:hypothetical protein
MDSMVGIEVCSEILKPAYLLAQQASGFQFAGGPLMPSEHSSDEEPPEGLYQGSANLNAD